MTPIHPSYFSTLRENFKYDTVLVDLFSVRRSLVPDKQNKVLKYTGFSYCILESVEFRAIT